MSEPSSKKVLEPQLIFFDNDNVAKAILPPLEVKPMDTAGLIKPEEGREPQEILAALEIPAPEAVLLISGGAAQVDQLSEFSKSRLAELFSRGVALAAAEKKAVIIDGGTYTGVMAMIGQGVADRHHKTPLIGVAPYHKVTFRGKATADQDSAPLDPNHSHFVLTKGHAWGDETGMMFALATELAKDIPTGAAGTPPETPHDKKGARENAPPISKQPIASRGFSPWRAVQRRMKPASAVETKIAMGAGETKAKPKAAPNEKPVVVVLAGGGMDGIAKREVLQAVRHGWRVIVIEGSGGVADKIADLVKQRMAIEARRNRQNKGALQRLWWRMGQQELDTSDSALREIVMDGKIALYQLGRGSEPLRQILKRMLSRPPAQNVLDMAWRRFADYDKNAARQQRAFDGLQKWLLILGVLATTLAVLYSVLSINAAQIRIANELVINVQELLRIATVIVTAVISGLVAYRNRFDPGAKYILLRANAENIKREIYMYRVEGDIYGRDTLAKNATTRDAELARRVGDIGSRTMSTEVGSSAVELYDGLFPPNMDAAAGKDDGFSDLDPDQYIAIRIGDQISFYRSKSTRIEKRLKRLQKLIFVAAGTGTLLAAFGFEPWVPVATALVAAFAAYVDYQQLDNTLTKYNQAETDLANADLWWKGLTKEEKEKNRDKLVKLTEHILESENAGWARRMQSAQAKLKESQDEPADVNPGGKSDHKPDKPGTADGGT